MTQRKLTPIANAVEEIENKITELRFSSSNKNYRYVIDGLKMAGQILEQLKGYERECIEQGFDDAIDQVYQEVTPVGDVILITPSISDGARQYFDTTYTQEGGQS